MSVGLKIKLPERKTAWFLFRKATLVQTCLATQTTAHYARFDLETAGYFQGINLADTILDACILVIMQHSVARAG